MFILALESRLISRWDAHKYARKAYDAGIRFIGGCCGFQPYHIRAVAEEVFTYSFDIITIILSFSFNYDSGNSVNLL